MSPEDIEKAIEAAYKEGYQDGIADGPDTAKGEEIAWSVSNAHWFSQFRNQPKPSPAPQIERYNWGEE